MGKREKLFMAIFLVLGLFLLKFGYAYGEQKVVAVISFKNLSGEGGFDNLEESVPNMLVTDLAASKKVRVVERSRLATVLGEHGIALSGLVDPETAKKVGKLIGADYLIAGTINKAGENIRIDAHLIKVETGEIEEAYKVYTVSPSRIIEITEMLAKKIIRGFTEEPVKPSPLPPVPKGIVLHLTTSLNNAYALADKESVAYLEIDLQSAKRELAKRLPLNLSLVIDRSGSMSSENKLEYTKNAALYAVENLSSDDVLSVVAYDDVVYTLIEANPLLNKDLVKGEIKKLTPGGSTNLAGGVEEGYKQVYKNLSPKRTNRVLLFSDGLANVGETNPEVLRNWAKKHYDEGVTISTLGVGLDYNENLMLNLAEYGSGNYYYIDSPDKIEEIFAKEFKGLLSIIAQNINICITTEEGVKLAEIYGYPYRKDGDKNFINLSNFLEGDRKYIIAKLLLPTQKVGGFKVAKVEIEYEDILRENQKFREGEEVVVKYTKDKGLIAKGLNIEVQKNVELTLSAYTLERASKLIDEGKFEEAEKVIKTRLPAVIEASLDLKAEELQENAGMLAGMSIKIEKAKAPAASEEEVKGAKKEVQGESYRQYKQQK
ncbi:MAG: hypothetical protein COS84_09505 [Armatimonadetes bacterium CG07_land_8_20_14_0_80_40_9]|nr:MAG: hypothetical protein COS84_09505 [Armatimonadetes bacterium CG07_land_8_20_14_0_80_40_9]